MSGQLSRGTKALFADAALMRLSSHVQTHVHRQAARICETLAADVARVRFPARVDHHVPLDVRSKWKPLVAHAAFVPPVRVVPRNTSAEGIGTLVLLAAHGIFETAGGHVRGHVAAPQVLRGERHRAAAAAKRLSRPVEQDMRREAGPAGEKAAANRALDVILL